MLQFLIFQCGSNYGTQYFWDRKNCRHCLLQLTATYLKKFKVDSGAPYDLHHTFERDMDLFPHSFAHQVISKYTQELEDHVIKATKGQRPNPSTYLSQEYIDQHLDLFCGGVTKFYAKAPTGAVGPPDGTFCASEYPEIEISKEDADKVMQDVKYAIKLALDYQNKQWGLVYAEPPEPLPWPQRPLFCAAGPACGGGSGWGKSVYIRKRRTAAKRAKRDRKITRSVSFALLLRSIMAVQAKRYPSLACFRFR